ncbi:MAG: hypothetical protein JKY30_08985 [Flavobacteriales bacterium]|nr:hypothetical protein [Flavobacteriales bacterium]
MKKSILIISAVFTTVSLMAFSYLNSATESSQELITENTTENIIEEPVTIDFVYDIDSRFMSTVTKEKLHNAKSILDFLPKSQTETVVSYDYVRVTILDDYHQTDMKATGKDDVLTAAQLKLLQTVDYSANILIRANFKQKNKVTGELEYNYFTPHITIVPEKEAEYVNGKDALIDYLKVNSQEQIAIVKDGKVKGGKLYFTVTKSGVISDVKLSATSGYPSIDKRMVELMTKAPGKWQAAENAKGEKVAQKLVFSFGTIGC